MTPTTFLYLALAAWRLCSLICNEEGPFYVFERIRHKATELHYQSRLARAFDLKKLVTCEWCASVWVGAALVILYLKFGAPVLYAAVALSLSAAVVILKYLVHTLVNGESYLKALKDEKEAHNVSFEQMMVEEQARQATQENQKPRTRDEWLTHFKKWGE